MARLGQSSQSDSENDSENESDSESQNDSGNESDNESGEGRGKNNRAQKSIIEVKDHLTGIIYMMSNILFIGKYHMLAYTTFYHN